MFHSVCESPKRTPLTLHHLAPCVSRLLAFEAIWRVSQVIRPASAFACVQQAWLHFLYLPCVLPSLWKALSFEEVQVCSQGCGGHAVPQRADGVALACSEPTTFSVLSSRHRSGTSELQSFCCVSFLPLQMAAVHHCRRALHRLHQIRSTVCQKKSCCRQISDLRSTCREQLHLEFETQEVYFATSCSSEPVPHRRVEQCWTISPCSMDRSTPT